MKMKGVLVITLLVLGCSFASAQTFGFVSVGISTLNYCNYEVLHQLAPYDVWEGSDVLTPCGVSQNATIAGSSVKLSAKQNPVGFKLKGVAYADNIYDAFSEAYTGAQWFVITNLECSLKEFGWIGFASASGVIFGSNYGWLWPCGPEARKAAANGHRLSIGANLPVRK
jgi:hypothetical protein